MKYRITVDVVTPAPEPAANEQRRYPTHEEVFQQTVDSDDPAFVGRVVAVVTALPAPGDQKP